MQNNRSRDFSASDGGDQLVKVGYLADVRKLVQNHADYYGGLHCGETFDVMVGGRWKPTRIEYGANWYLVGIRADDLSGLRVRI